MENIKKYHESEKEETFECTRMYEEILRYIQKYTIYSQDTQLIIDLIKNSFDEDVISSYASCNGYRSSLDGIKYDEFKKWLSDCAEMPCINIPCSENEFIWCIQYNNFIFLKDNENLSKADKISLITKYVNNSYYGFLCENDKEPRHYSQVLYYISHGWYGPEVMECEKNHPVGISGFRRKEHAEAILDNPVTYRFLFANTNGKSCSNGEEGNVGEECDISETYIANETSNISEPEDDLILDGFKTEKLEEMAKRFIKIGEANAHFFKYPFYKIIFRSLDQYNINLEDGKPGNEIILEVHDENLITFKTHMFTYNLNNKNDCSVLTYSCVFISNNDDILKHVKDLDDYIGWYNRIGYTKFRNNDYCYTYNDNASCGYNCTSGKSLGINVIE